jgi:diguanylate cyclase (GGDEF)-like protein
MSQSSAVPSEQTQHAHQILVVDDEEFIRCKLRRELEELGYRVRVAHDARSALQAIQDHVPDLVLLDMIMPVPSDWQGDGAPRGEDGERLAPGAAICHEIKRSGRTSAIPVIMLTSVSKIESKIAALQCGANDYLIKPYDSRELSARVKNALDLRDRHLEASPLTGLPGNTEIERQLRQRVASRRGFAYLYVDIDDFKAFNDLYGHERGDRLILATAELLRDCIEQREETDTFVGHVGGDDFVIMCSFKDAEAIARAITQAFDQMIVDHLDQRELDRGWIEVPGRTGGVERHRLISVTVAVVGGDERVYEHAADLSSRAAEVKRHAKALARRGERGAGSYVAWERRIAS